MRFSKKEKMMYAPIFEYSLNITNRIIKINDSQLFFWYSLNKKYPNHRSSILTMYYRLKIKEMIHEIDEDVKKKEGKMTCRTQTYCWTH